MNEKLIIAVKIGYVEGVQHSLVEGGDPNAKGQDGASALDWANLIVYKYRQIENDQKEKSINAKNIRYLLHAVGESYEKGKEWREQNSKRTADMAHQFIIAVKISYVKGVQHLLVEGGDPNAKGQDGASALDWANLIVAKDHSKNNTDAQNIQCLLQAAGESYEKGKEWHEQRSKRIVDMTHQIMDNARKQKKR